MSIPAPLTVNDKSLALLSEASRQEIAAQVADATKAAQKLLDSALAIEVIDSPFMLDQAALELRNASTKLKDLDERRKEITRPFDAAKAFVMDLFAQPSVLVKQADTHLRGVVQVYNAEQERIAAEARKAAEETARLAREEAARVAAEAAEKQRLRDEEAAEAQRAADALLAAASNKRQREAAEAAQAAAAAAAVAAQEAAEQAAVAAEEVEEVEMVRTPVYAAPAARGVATRTRWVVKAIDLAALVQAAAKDPNLLVYLQADEKRIAQIVTAMKEHTNIPGVTAGTDSSLSVRRS